MLVGRIEADNRSREKGTLWATLEVLAYRACPEFCVWGI